MKIWARVMTRQRIEADCVQAFDARPTDADGWETVLHELCKPLDLSRPVLLEKHFRELARFDRTAFFPSDFMEPVPFDRFELEIFPEKRER